MNKMGVSNESTNQYVRRNNIQKSGIPEYVKDKDLKDTMKDILERIDITTKKQ